MKSLITLLSILCCSLGLQAQQLTPPRALQALAPATADDHGIITEQPAGELRYYIRSGGATYAGYYFMKATQDGMATEVVFSEDGTKAYFKNIISHAATGTWVEGRVEGDAITVPLGQMAYWWDAYGYGMKLAWLKVNGTIEDYSFDVEGTVRFTIDADTLRMEGSSGDPDSNTFEGLGFVYTEYKDATTGAVTPEGEWSYYLDYGTALTHKRVSSVVPPADLQTELYSLEHDNTGHLVRVGFDGNDVYIQGVSERRVASAWMKGELHNNVITFPLQYAGIYSNYMLFFNAAYGEYRQGADGYYNWFYSWTDGTLTLAYDAETRSFGSNLSIFVSNSDTDMGSGEILHSPVFRPYTERAGTPADPAIAFYQHMGRFTVLGLDVPLQDTEGNFMDPAKVAYRIYLADDEPFVFYPDEYKGLSEEITEVPYLFTEEQQQAYSRSYIYEKASYLYIFQNGIDQLGIQSIYRGGGEEHRSPICYRDLTGIDAPGTETATPQASFDLSGRQVTREHKGLTITRLSDGRIVKSLKK